MGISIFGFNGPGRAHRYVSAVDVLNQTCSAEDIQDKVIFIGSSATGLNDLHQTVFDPNYPGIEVHAAILSSIYDNNQIIKPVWSTHVVAGGVLLTGIAMVVFLSLSSSPLVLALGSLAIIGCVLLCSAICFVLFSVFISPGLPVSLRLQTLLFLRLFGLTD